MTQVFVVTVAYDYLKQVVGDVVPVTEHLDALALRVSLAPVTDEKPFKIFVAVHIAKLFMLTARS